MGSAVSRDAATPVTQALEKGLVFDEVIGRCVVYGKGIECTEPFPLTEILLGNRSVLSNRSYLVNTLSPPPLLGKAGGLAYSCYSVSLCTKYRNQ